MESEGSLPRLQQPISCVARKPDQSSAQKPPHFTWVRQEILKRTDRILEIKKKTSVTVAWMGCTFALEITKLSACGT